MKNKLILIILLIFSTSTLKAELNQKKIDYCDAMKGLAELVMTNRQAGVDPLEVLEEALKVKDSVKDVYILFIIRAYREYFVFEKYGEKQLMINKFGNDVYNNCLNGVNRIKNN
mgnify:CR=1 FL=1